MLVLYSLNPLDLTQEQGSAKYQELLRPRSFSLFKTHNEEEKRNALNNKKRTSQAAGKPQLKPIGYFNVQNWHD